MSALNWAQFLLLTVLTAVECDQNGPVTITVKARSGIYLGTNCTSDSGVPYHCFFGMRYAKRITQQKRFKPAELVEDSERKLDATKPGICCIQHNFLGSKTEIVGGEDCLNVNVYTPSLNQNLPVLVVINAGFYSFVSGSKEAVDPDYFMETKKIVIVTFNYRVGLFGFANFNMKEYPANLGMKDQVLLLKWVQKNIEFFGGNKDRVTIQGMSAGASSVHLHMMSPLSRGLFRAAISESGSALCTFGMNTRQATWERFKFVADRCGCGHAMPKNWRVPAVELANCFKNKSAYEIEVAFTSIDIYDLIPVFGPVVEKPGTEDAFLTIDPWFAPPTMVPWLAGSNSQEGAIITTTITSGKILEKYNVLVSLLLPYIFEISMSYKYSTADPLLVTIKIVQRYLHKALFNLKLSQSKILDKGIASGIIHYPLYLSLKNHKGPKYSYIFGYKNVYPNGTFEHPYTNQGVTHGEEFPFLFKKRSRPIREKFSAKDIEMSKTMVKLWLNFVTHLNPTPKPWVDEFDRPVPIWDQWNETTNMKYIIGQNESHMGKDPFFDEYEFWSELPYHNKGYND